MAPTNRNAGQARREARPRSPARREGGRTARGQRTRQKLVTAAREVFERDGFLNARIADICAFAGVSHGSFYTYFDSKDEIFREVAESVEIDLLTIEPRHGESTPRERILAANRHYLEAYREHARLMAVISEVSILNPSVRDVRLGQQLAFARVIQRRIEAFQAEGIASKEVDAWFAANALGGMVAFVADYMLVQGVKFDFDHAVEQLTILWVNSLGLTRPDLT